MLTIKKTENIFEANAYLKSRNIDHDLTGEQVMTMTSGTDICALGSLSLIAGKVYLNFVFAEENNWDMTYGITKALLNMADLRGIQTIYGNNPTLDRLYTALRFQKTENDFVLNLEGYFTADKLC